MSRWLAKYKTAALGTALAAALVSATLLAQQPTVFTANVKLVHVIASVKNAKGELVGALKKSDFRVFDNGAEQEIKVFEPQSATPLSVALMIDVSGSTAKDLKYETDSATKFMHALLAQGNPADAVKLYDFDSDVREATHSFTHNYSALEASLRTIHGSGGTSVYDAVFLASGDLERREGRKVLVMVSDGGDTTSNTKIHAALKEAQLADAVIYGIVVMPITNEAGRNTGGEHALEYMAEGTGGRTFYPRDSKALDKAFIDIVNELRTQYFLGYYPKDVPLTKDPFHRLEVRVAQSDLQVSARNGYYGDAEGSVNSPSTTPIAVTPERKKK